MGQITNANAAGKSASFVCGCYVRISLQIDDASQVVTGAKFGTNGCGYVVAATDVLCDWLCGRSLTGFHGLASADLNDVITRELCQFPDSRSHCSEIVFEALRRALADFRMHRIEEFHSEKALICTCFGVSEETVEKCIVENSVETVDEVIDLCRAGGGCGSCQLLIREMIDSFQLEVR
jgi:NifU-like protein